MKSIISMLSVLMLSLVFVACSSTGQATGLGTDATDEVNVLVADAINEANALKDVENAIQYANFEVQIDEILARIEEDHGDHDATNKHTHAQDPGPGRPDPPADVAILLNRTLRNAT